METLGKLVVGIILGVLGILLGGFIFMKLWGWFVLPVFVELPVLTLGQSIGITFFISILKYKRDKDEEGKDFGDIVGDWVTSIIYSLFLFGMSWIVYLFIS